LQLTIPPFPKKENQNIFIRDPVRKKIIKATPEEWVRQHIITYLHNQLGYPYSLMSIERAMKVNQLYKRTDIVVYHNGNPYILIECKAQNYKINSVAWIQTFIYQSKLSANFFMLSNGNEHHIYKIHEHKILMKIDELPYYKEIL